MGPGVTASTIEIGLRISADAQATTNALGSDGEGNIDERNAVRAIVSYFNAHGGVAGRKIVPVIYEMQTANYLSASGRERMSQEACALWTEDHHVAVILPGAGFFPNSMIECAAKADTPYIISSPLHTPMPNSAFSRYSKIYYALNLINAEPYARTLCDGLWGQGFFGKDARVGIMTYDDPWVREGVDGTLKPCLKSHGVNVVSEARYPEYVESPWSTYVLQFQSARVTHVVWPYVGFGGFPFAFFTRAAESQQYRPLYGAGTNMFAGGALAAGNAPRNQVQNIHGVGWSPYVDLYQQTPTSPNAELCFQILREAGYAPANIASKMLFICNAFLFVKAVFDRATALTTSGFQASVETLGNAFDEPMAIDGASSFGPTNHDGAALVRDFAYSTTEGQFVYTSPARGVSR